MRVGRAERETPRETSGDKGEAQDTHQAGEEYSEG